MGFGGGLFLFCGCLAFDIYNPVQLANQLQRVVGLGDVAIGAGGAYCGKGFYFRFAAGKVSIV